MGSGKKSGTAGGSASLYSDPASAPYGVVIQARASGLCRSDWRLPEFIDFVTPLNDPASQSIAAWRKHLPVTLRPVTKLSYALEAEIGWSRDPAPRRLVSVAFHAATSVLLFLLIARLAPRLTPLGAALLAALLAAALIVAWIVTTPRYGRFTVRSGRAQPPTGCDQARLA